MFRWNCGPTLQEHLATEYEITSTFKPNAPLGNGDEDLGKLGKDRTKRDHIIIVGGSGNSWIEITITQLKSTSTSLR